MPPFSLPSLSKLIFSRQFQISPTPSSTHSFNSVAAILTQRLLDSAPLPTPELLNTPSSSFHHFPDRIRSSQQTQFLFCGISRKYSGGSENSKHEFDQDRQVDMINLKFAEAREEIEMALESKETVYFDEEAECARAAVNEVLKMFEGLLAKLPEKERKALQRSMGLKIEQLKAELKQLDE